MIVAALLIGRRGSKGLAGKNTRILGGYHCFEWPMRAAAQVGGISSYWMNTDCEIMKRKAIEQDWRVIDRPVALASDDALAEDVFEHSLSAMRTQGTNPDVLVLLMANAPTINSKLIEDGIKILLDDPEVDSAVTCSRYNMWSPLRARILDHQGYLQPYLPFDQHPNSTQLSCDRDSQGDVWFADMGASIVRVSNIENMESGLLPQKWMGKRIAPVANEGGLDIDYEWQCGQAEWWVNKLGSV